MDNEQFIRQEIRKILIESSQELILENQFGDFATTGDLYKTFIGPFVNVFKVAKIAFKDITTSTIYTLRSVLSFDAKEQERLRTLWKKKHESYKGEYATAMKDVDAALASSDAKLLAFMFNPGVAMGTAVAEQALDLGEPVIDYARDKLDMLSDELDARLDLQKTKQNTAQGPIRGILGDLKSLFFGEGYHAGPLLEKEEKEGSELPELSIEEVTNAISDEEAMALITAALKDSKFGQKLQKDAEALIAEKTGEIEAMKTLVKDKMAALNKLVTAQSLEEMAAPSQALQAMGADLSKQMQQVEKLVAEKKEELSGPDGQKIMDDLRKTPDGKSLPEDAKPEDFFPLLEKGIIASAFQGGVAEARKELLQSTMDFVAGEMKPSDFTELAKVSPMGKAYSDLVMNFAKELATL